MARRNGRVISFSSGQATGAGGQGEPPPVIFQRRLELRRTWSVALLCLLSSALLTISFAPFSCWLIAYIALAPWVLGVGGCVTKRAGLACGTLAGVVFWAGNLYWLWWITLTGYAATVVYLSAYWLLAAMVVRAAFRRNWPMWLVLPLVWVSLEYARAYVISGFPWFFLAQSQYAQTHLIQFADLAGQYGVSFFVAMVNGAIVDLFTYPLFSRAKVGGARMAWFSLVGAAATVATGALLVVYGAYRLGQQRALHPGPVIGIVQHAYPISLRGRDVPPEEILDAHLASSRALLGAGCDLVIWPETMLPAGLNAEFLAMDEQLLGESAREALQTRRSWGERVARLSEQLGCPILAGGITYHVNRAVGEDEEPWLIRNSALWFEGATPWAMEYYAKMHLVPFSEYVPFRASAPWLHKLLRRFVPPVMLQLDPGRTPTVFELRRSSGEWTLATPICYEGTFARVCRRLVMAGRHKEADILVNISNDGWFVWKWGDGPYRGSTEHSQHLVQYCFRAVENRTPVVRAVNTGISASIDSCGRIVALLGDRGIQPMMTGTLLLDGAYDGHGRPLPGHGPKVLVDERVTLYSLMGDVFAQGVSLLAAAMTVWLIIAARRSRSGRKVKG